MDKFRYKLTDFQVRCIRDRLLKGDSYKSIFKNYSYLIGWWSFRDVCRGNTWKSLLTEEDKKVIKNNRLKDYRLIKKKS
jgi:hypothetical protein